MEGARLILKFIFLCIYFLLYINIFKHDNGQTRVQFYTDKMNQTNFFKQKGDLNPTKGYVIF